MDSGDDFFLQREFIGYGYNTPDPQWPGGAKIAISIVVNYNMGSEQSPELGDAAPESMLLDIPRRGAAKGPRNDINESAYEFGGRQGVPRLLNLFKK